jgi:hypothetical protein
MDMHANSPLCWTYTVVMVFVQIFVFQLVQGNRVRGREKKAKERTAHALSQAQKKKGAEKVERERLMGGGDGAGDERTVWLNGNCNEDARRPQNGNGTANAVEIPVKRAGVVVGEIEDTEGSITETSEEEMII